MPPGSVFTLATATLALLAAAAPAVAADAILRREAVHLDHEALATSHPARGDVLPVALFGGEPIDVRLEQILVRTPSSFTWRGRLAGEPDAPVTIVSHEGVVLMNIRSPRLGFLQVRPGADGGPELQQVEPVDLPACGVGEEAVPALFRPSLRPATTPADGGNIAGGGPCVEDGSVVDILVVYTSQAATGAGGAAAMEAQIILAVDETNVAFANSQVPVTIRLAGMQEVTYGEYGSSGTDLNRLIEPADGYLDEVHGLRDAAAADIVSLITEAANVCGIARVSVGPGPTPLPESAFNIVARGCLAGPNLVFAHELAHNFGCLHDWAEDACDAGALPSAKGHVEPGGAFRTVMAYGAAPTIPHFSNPDVLYDGLPTGVAGGQPGAADNALALTLSAPFVANYRSLDCNGNGLCDTDDIAGGFSDDVNGNGIPDECEADCDGNGLPDDYDIAQGAADVNANGLPDACEPAVLFVDAAATGSGLGATWSDAKPDLQQALAIATTPGSTVQEIWVAAGTYAPGPAPHRAATFRMMSGVAIYGGFAGTESVRDERDPAMNPTILSGDLAGDDGPDFANDAENSITVVTGSYTDDTAVLDGFVIRGGNADPDFNGCWFSPYNAGGGIRVFGGSPTIRNCLVTANASTGGGGGAYVVQLSSPTFVGCDFIGNLANGPATSASGGGARLSPNIGNAVTLIDCRFIDNVSDGSGGGVANLCDSCTYVNVEFRGNVSASSGGGLDISGAFDASPVLTNCLFLGNTAGTVGGGVYSYGAGGSSRTPTFAGCTLVGNAAANVGGSSWAFFDAPVFDNCILWGNTDNGGTDESAQLFYGSPILTSCTVQGWTGALGGVNNDGSDPLFIDADGPDDIFGTDDDDVRLAAGSPAIDSGDNALLPADALDLDGDGDTIEPHPLDLDGNERTVDGDADATPQVDRGAFEYEPEILCPADLDGDGQVGITDLLDLLASWGSCGGCAADLDGDGLVNIVDLLALLSAWGGCG